MTAYSMPRVSSDVVRSTVDQISIDTVTISSGQGTLSAGTVMEFDSVAGEWIIAAASITTEVLGVLATNVVATADTKALMVVRTAAVSANSLIFDASFDTQAKKDAAIARLASLGVVAR